MIRSRLYSGFRKSTLNIGALAEDERLKLVLPQSCCYCGSTTDLTVDHLLPRSKGGENVGENMVWACRSCNSSKGATDLLAWLQRKGQFPPLLLLRRYLKLAIEYGIQHDLLETPLAEVSPLPFSPPHLPSNFPQPIHLRLWIVDLP